MQSVASIGPMTTTTTAAITTPTGATKLLSKTMAERVQKRERKSKEPPSKEIPQKKNDAKKKGCCYSRSQNHSPSM